MIKQAGSTDVTTYFKLIDATTGAPKTGLTVTDLDLTYVRALEASVKADATALGSPSGAHSDNAAIEVDSTNCPGLYRVDWPDAAFATGQQAVELCVNAAGVDPAYIEVELVNYDPQDTAGLGLSNLDAAVSTRSTFNAASDTVTLASATHTGAVIPNVTLVGTCTTNTDMRGTDNAILASSAPTNWSAMVIGPAGEVECLVQGYLSTLLTETTPGRIAGNFDTFFENADAVTTKTVDDVGTGAGGSSDWSVTERNQIRYRLGVDGTAAAPSTNSPNLSVTVETNNDKSGYELAASQDVYHADVVLTLDEANTNDEYTVTWFKNGQRLTTGITSPQIQVLNRLDGSDLIALTAMTEIGSSGSYKHDESTNRVTAGEAGIAIVTASIDSAQRTWSTIVSVDSNSST